MNKRITLTASVIIILSLIACGNKETKSVENESSEPNISSVEETTNNSDSSSVYSEMIIIDPPSSIPSSSSEVISSSEISSSQERSSLQNSSEDAPSSAQSIVISASEVISSSSDISSASESSIPSSSTPEGYHHVVFQNYDETVLYEVDVEEGHEAIYVGETPVKPEDEDFIYEFSGWDKDLTNILSDVIAVAQYSYTAKENWGPIIWF